MFAVSTIKVCHHCGGARTMERRKCHLRSSDTDDDTIILGSRRTWHSAQGRYHDAVSGGISLIDTAQPCVSAHPESLDVISFLVPRAALDQALGPSRHAVGASITAAQTSFPIVAAGFSPNDWRRIRPGG